MVRPFPGLRLFVEKAIQTFSEADTVGRKDGHALLEVETLGGKSHRDPFPGLRLLVEKTIQTISEAEATSGKGNPNPF